jgi:uncharacterized lipoprotein YbaY
MKTHHLLFAFFLTCLMAQSSFGQSWLDYTRQALPRVNIPNMSMNSNLNQPYQNYPNSVPYDQSMQNPGAGAMLVPNRKDWKLGVYVQNTEVGAVVTQVAPGSAGQLAGIEPNDVIVAVGGSRVGSFDNRIVELSDEIRRNADPMGRLSLLVLDSRQRTLQSLPITMNSNSTALGGTVVTRDRVQLPYGATLTVQLQNMSQPYYDIAGGKSISRADGVGPFPFELNCDPRYLDPRSQYQLNAVISVNNQILYTLPQPILVDVNNLGRPVSLVLERSGSVAIDASGNNFPGAGNVVSVGYPGALDNNQMQRLFLDLLNRAPSAREVVAWQAYLQQGNSINDLKVKLLSSAQFRDRFPNDGAYLQQLVTSLSGRVPNQQELAFWMQRLQSTGQTEVVINEMLLKNR